MDLNKDINRIQRRVLLVILDGVGASTNSAKLGNAVSAANLPTLKKLWNECPTILLKAHGTAVGMPSDEDMGNSEVGHNVLGAGRIFDQGAKLVKHAIETGAIFSDKTWISAIQNCRSHDSTFHFIGLLSDGNVHSHIDHLKSLLTQTKKEGIKNVRIHILLDGRDVPKTSALEYVNELEMLIHSLNDPSFNARIASGGGRMVITMDRYNADWEMVKKGWDTHVLGIGRKFATAKIAIETYRLENPNITDQDLPSFVIEENNNPVGKISDGDTVLLFNFRGDRAIEISKAFDDDQFDYFERKNKPKIFFCGMIEYDGDSKIPKNYLVSPPIIKDTISELLTKVGIRQYAISETQKFGHVTYFWNGNKPGYFDKSSEKYTEIPSELISFDKAPNMKALEITEDLLRVIETDNFNFIRVNYPNGDMVGHTGDFKATVKSLEVIDSCIQKLVIACKEKNIVLLITADHGNADEMYQLDKNGKLILDEMQLPIPKTSHTLNPVHFVIVDNKNEFTIKSKMIGVAGLGNIAATILQILGFIPPKEYLPSLIQE